MNDMPLSKGKMYKNAIKILWTLSLYQNSKYIKTQISFY